MKREVAMVFVATCLLPMGLVAQVRVDEARKICHDLPPDQRPTVAVMDFKIKVDVTGEVGGGMASMLSNALLNSGCFNVVERARLDDVMNEQAFGQSGAVTEESAANLGQIRGARYQILGELTEFSQNEAAVSGAARRLGRVFSRGRVAEAAGNFGLRRAHIGFIIRIVDTSSALVLSSQSFEKKRNSVGLAGSAWGRGAFAGAGQISKAMADAIEEGIIGAVQYLAPFRTQMADATPAVQSAKANISEIPKVCELLESAARPPRVLVAIPEEHLLGHFGSYGDGRAFEFDEYEGNRHAQPQSTIDINAMQASVQRAIRPPDPAGETEIVKRFIERGFLLVDERQMQSLRQESRFLLVDNDPAVAAALGREFEADIVITGEAFSEFSKQINGMTSCRARVEAKAIEVSTGRIVAADGLHASAADVSEVIAGKTALRKAGGKVADYFYTEICADKKFSYVDGTSAPFAVSDRSPGVGSTELVISQIDFASSSRLQKALVDIELISNVRKESFQNGTVKFRVEHRGPTDQLAETLLGQAKIFPLEILALEDRKILANLQD